MLGKAIKTRFGQFSHQILIVAVVIGAGLRWFQIGRHSFWYDESFSGLTARLRVDQILSNVAIDVHPPGYYLLLHYWIQLGESEAFIRSFSALFSIGAVILIYGLGRWLFDRSVATLAALGMAIIPFQVYFAQEARMYGLVVFLTIAITWVFLHAVVAKGGWLAWGGYALIATFGLYVHYFVAFLLFGLYVWFAMEIRRYRTVILRFFLANSLIVLLFLPQFNQALSRAGAYLGTEAWQAVPSVLSPLTTIYYLLFAHRSPIWIFPIGLFLTLTALLLVFWEGRRIKTEHRFELALWFSVLVPIVTVTIISWLAIRSIYVERSFAVASPALVLLLARGTLAAPRWSPTPYLVALLLFPIIVTLITNVSTSDPAKPPVREAMLVIEKDFASHDVSLHLQDASGIPALWYNPGIPHILADVPDSAFIFASTHRLFGGDVSRWQSTLDGADRLWLTVMPGFTGPGQIAVQEEIQTTYPLLMVKDWGSVQLYLYDLQHPK